MINTANREIKCFRAFTIVSPKIINKMGEY